MPKQNAAALLAFNRSLPVAKRVARKYLHKFPATLLPEEIESAALEGLWQTALAYTDLDQERFEFVAAVRVRGAIIDLVRQSDWLPRRARKGFGGQLHRFSIDSIVDISHFAELSTPAPDEADRIDAASESAALRVAIESLRKRDRYIIGQVLRDRNKTALAK